MATGQVFVFAEGHFPAPSELVALRGRKFRRMIGGATSVTVLDASYTAHTAWRRPDDDRIGDDEEHLAQFEVSDAASGQNHTAIVTSDGAVFSWGIGEHGQLGWARPVSSRDPVQVGGGLDHVNAVSVAIGLKHTLVLTEKGDVFACGEGACGQTGLGSTAAKPSFNPCASLQLLPRFIPATLHPTVVQIACGGLFSACVTADGEVWTWGEGSCGALGTGRCTSRAVPAPALDIDHPHGPFTSVVAGDSHAAARSKSGRVYVWGLNAHGQLGLGDTTARFRPVQLSLGAVPDKSSGADPDASADAPRTGRRVVAFAAAAHSSAFVTKAGEVWTCGTSGPQLARPVSGADSAPAATAARVHALDGVCVSRAACAQGALAVFAPTSLKALSVSSGPRHGGTRLRLRCSGAYPSPALAVRFAGEDMPPVDVPATMGPDGEVECTVPPLRYKRPPEAGAALAAARAELAAARLSGEEDAIAAAEADVRARETVPPFVTVGVRLSLNGVDFTKERPAFTYYAPPTVEASAPALGPRNGGTRVLLSMAGDYLPSPDTRARLVVRRPSPTGADEDDVRVDVAGTDTDTGTDTETETETSEPLACTFDSATNQLAFATPRMTGTGAAELQLAANGVDFERAGEFTLYAADMVRCFPAALPAAAACTVRVTGTGLCESAEATVRVRLPHETISLPATARTDAVEFEWPGLDEDGIAACADACGAATAGFCGRGTVSVAINGVDYSDAVAIGISHGQVVSVDPPCAPSTGRVVETGQGTEAEVGAEGGDGEGAGEAAGQGAGAGEAEGPVVRVRCDGALLPTAEARVRFALPDGRAWEVSVDRWETEREGKAAEGQAEDGTEEGDDGKEAEGKEAEGKASEEPAEGKEAEGKASEEPVEGKEAEEEEEVGARAGVRARHVAVVRAPVLVSPEEAEAARTARAEAEAEAAASRPASKKGKKGGKGGPTPEELQAAVEARAAELRGLLAQVSVALDGETFDWLGSVPFQFHGPIEELALSAAAVVAGQPVAVSGPSLFRAPRHADAAAEALRVRFRPKGGDGEEGVVVPVEYDEEGTAQAVVPVVEGAGKEVEVDASYDGLAFFPAQPVAVKYKAK